MLVTYKSMNYSLYDLDILIHWLKTVLLFSNNKSHYWFFLL